MHLIKFRIYDELSMSAFVSDVSSFVLNFPDSNQLNIHDSVKLFCDGLYEIYDENFPIRTKRLSHKRIS